MNTNSTLGPLLVVEDNPDVWMILKIVLPIALPQVPFMHAANATTALTCVCDCLTKEEPFRLVLQNLYLPDRADGLMLLSNIKQRDRQQQLPIVVMSSSRDQQDIDDVYRLGASAYLVKPAEVNQWIKLLRTLPSYWQEAINK